MFFLGVVLHFKRHKYYSPSLLNDQKISYTLNLKYKT